MLNPVTVVVGEEGVVIVPAAGPLIFVQVPAPTAGALPAMVTEPVVMQMVWSGPAFETVGGALTITEIWSLLAVQGVLVIVHWNTYVPALVMPVIVVVGEEGVVIVPPAGPLTFVQRPAPAAGALPAMVAVPAALQMV